MTQKTLREEILPQILQLSGAISYLNGIIESRQSSDKNDENWIRLARRIKNVLLDVYNSLAEKCGMETAVEEFET